MNTQTNSENPKTLSEFVLEFLNHRVSDPLWRTYLVFFLIHNWKAAGVLLLGNVSNPVERVSHAKFYLESNTFLTFNIYGQVYWIVPLVLSLLYIYVYLRFIKPKVIEIYNRNNNLSLESAKRQIKEMESKIGQLEKEKMRQAQEYEENEKKWESTANLLDIFIVKHLKFEYYNVVRKAEQSYNGKKKGDIYSNYEGRIRKVVEENKDMILDVDKEMYEELLTKLK
nr:hypothetical protein GTC16762_32340 [Pigmentibacter ruber]